MRILTAVGLTNHCINNLFIYTEYDFEKDQHFANLLLKLKICLQFEHILQLFFSLFFRMSNFSTRFFHLIKMRIMTNNENYTQIWEEIFSNWIWLNATRKNYRNSDEIIFLSALFERNCNFCKTLVWIGRYSKPNLWIAIKDEPFVRKDIVFEVRTKRRNITFGKILFCSETTWEIYQISR